MENMKTETAKNHTTGQSHKVRPCRECGAPIVLLKSTKGFWYPADAIRWTASTEGSFGERSTYFAVQPWRGRHECGTAPAEETKTVRYRPSKEDYLSFLEGVEAIEDEYGIDSEAAKVADAAARELWNEVKNNG
jgi:hypothetical protein